MQKTVITSFIAYQSTFNPDNLERDIHHRERNLLSNNLKPLSWAVYTSLANKRLVQCDFICEDTYRPLGDTVQRGTPIEVS